MGILSSCLKGEDDEPSVPTPATMAKRQQLAEAAEKRIREAEARGVKDPEKYKRMQDKRDERERALEADGGATDGPLRWQVQ